MNLIEFVNNFPTDGSCEHYYAELRLQQGIVCKQCKEHTHHYYCKSVKKFQCSKCRSRTNLKAGTIMEKSKLSIRLWFLCLHLMTSIKKSLSALEMQRQLGYKFYEPIWYMMHKIRSTMGKRDARYQLAKNFEIDDAFFTTVGYSRPDGNFKRGRGSERKSKVLVMVESEPAPQPKAIHKPARKMGYLKMVVMDDLSSAGINYEVKKAAAPSATAISDD